jgi:hypothetical protein
MDEMVTRAESKKIWEQVKANHAKLDACEGHEFSPVAKYPDRPDHALKDYVCTKCGGRIDAIAHHWYQMGMKHEQTRRK